MEPARSTLRRSQQAQPIQPEVLGVIPGRPEIALGGLHEPRLLPELANGE